MKNSLQVFKGCQLFSPHKVCAMKVDADKVKEALLPIPFLSSKVELDQLLAELPAYLACADDASSEVDPLE